MARTATGESCSLLVPFLFLTRTFKETSTKTATRRANAKVKDGQLLYFGYVCAYTHMFFIGRRKGEEASPICV
jgi:hypothetical protein